MNSGKRFSLLAIGVDITHNAYKHDPNLVMPDLRSPKRRIETRTANLELQPYHVDIALNLLIR